MDVLIPKGYVKIAKSVFTNTTAQAYFHLERHYFIIQVDDKIIGPIEKLQLESLKHVVDDVIQMRGRYGPVSE